MSNVATRQVDSAKEEDFDTLSRLFAEAFASKFAHNNLDLEQASKLNKIDFEINKDSLLPFCGVVRSDSGKALAMCHLTYGKDCLTNEEKEVDLSRKSPPSDLVAQRLGLSYLDRWRAWRLELIHSEKPDPLDCYISSLAVDASLRGQGVGTHLLNWAKQQALARGAKFLTLHVAVSNVGAWRLYERFGFTIDEQKSVTGWMERMACDFFVGEKQGFYFVKYPLEPSTDSK